MFCKCLANVLLLLCEQLCKPPLLEKLRLALVYFAQFASTVVSFVFKQFPIHVETVKLSCHVLPCFFPSRVLLEVYLNAYVNIV